MFVAQQYSPNHHHTKETPHIKPVKRAEEVLLCVFVAVAVVVGGQLAVRTRSQQRVHSELQTRNRKVQHRQPIRAFIQL